MLVIAGRIELDPKHRESAVAAAREMMAETAKEPGCRSYVFSAEFDDPGAFRIFEEWDSEDALKLHFQAPHMAKFRAAMGGFGIKSLKTLRYDVSKVGPLNP